MITILSPSKTMSMPSDYIRSTKETVPKYHTESVTISEHLKYLTKVELQEVMKTSNRLTDEVASIYLRFINNGKNYLGGEAIRVYTGHAYKAFDVETCSTSDIEFAQEHLRIMSAMYGVIRPKDIVQEYRLEMAARVSLLGHKNLYSFWKAKVTDALITDMERHNTSMIINLASKEYTKAIDLKAVEGRIITIDFKEKKNDSYRSLAVYSKHARGRMARYIIDNRIDNAEGVKAFDLDNYSFSVALSDKDSYIFTREKDKS